MCFWNKTHWPTINSLNMFDIRFLTFILYLSYAMALSAQTTMVTIQGKIDLNSGNMPRYMYIVQDGAKDAGKILEQKKISPDGKFTFQTKGEYTDTLLYQRIIISNKEYRNYDEHITDIREGRISINKDFFNFIIDSNYIHLELMPSIRKINVQGGHENRGDMAYREIIAYRDQEYNKPNRDLSAINREVDRKIIALAIDYNNSISAVRWLRSVIMSMRTDFTHQAAILDAIDNLDESVLKHRVGEVRKLYASTVAKYTPKTNVLFPNRSILEDMGNATINLLDQYKTYDYVLIDFWATWCVPCIQQHPQIKALAEKYETNPKVVIVGISVDKKKEDWKAYLIKNPFNYPNYWLLEKDHEKIVNDLGVVTIPRYMLLRLRDNTLVEMKMDAQDLDTILEKYLTI